MDLALVPSAGPGEADIVLYDFAEHRARFGVEPEPRFVLTAVTDVPGAATLIIGYEVPQPTGGVRTGTATVSVLRPERWLSTSFGVVLRPGDEGQAVLRSLRAQPPPSAGHVAEQWRVTALLGNLATLLWVAGAERDVLDRHVAGVRALARVGERVTGATLDRIGYDLGVPRFPPQPYGQEDGTVALYHLGDARGASVRDAWPLYLGGGAGHPGAATAGVQAESPGRFGTAMRFAVLDAEIAVPHAAALSTGATASLTAECFVKPDTMTGDGAVLSKHADPADAALPGWALSVGAFGRGIPRNVRLRIGDGTASRDLFADRPLPTARFTHLAAVVDRAAGQARLVVDGEVVAAAPLTATGGLPALSGALANTEPVRIGRKGVNATSTFAGTIDEVRLSSAARAAFHPVLGEADEGYRLRLRIFRRWVLPTRSGVQAALNDVVGTLAGVADPFVVTDADATLVQATHALTVLPVAVPAGGTLDDTGRRGLGEADVLEPPARDKAFAAELLVDGSDPRVEFAQPPAAGDPRLMRTGTRVALRTLLGALAASGVADRLRVLARLRSRGRGPAGRRPRPGAGPSCTAAGSAGRAGRAGRLRLRRAPAGRRTRERGRVRGRALDGVRGDRGRSRR
ncbi:LamG-like jellyroll fold domain-containing protein [Nonomuraea ferruginea]